MAEELNISLVTLPDWMKKGLMREDEDLRNFISFIKLF